MQSSNRSLEELTLRYQRFCEKNGLDENLQPEEQTPETDAQQLWLDHHVSACAKALAEENVTAPSEVVQQIAKDVTYEPRTARPVVTQKRPAKQPKTASPARPSMALPKEDQLLLF